jgi:hypothetical protein
MTHRSTRNVFMVQPNVRIQTLASFVTEDIQAFVIIRLNSWQQISQNTRYEIFTLVTTNISALRCIKCCVVWQMWAGVSEKSAVSTIKEAENARLLPQKRRQKLYQATRRHAPQDDVLQPRNMSLLYKVTRSARPAISHSALHNRIHKRTVQHKLCETNRR